MEIDVKTTQNTVQTLLNNDIQTMEELLRLNDDEIKALKTVGEKKFEEIKTLIEIGKEIDVFKYFGNNSIKPNRMFNFFYKHQIYQGNVLQTRLAKLNEVDRLTNGKLNAFLEFKNKVFRNKYNFTLDDKILQSQNDVTKKIVDTIMTNASEYLSNELLISIKKDLIEMVDAIEFKQVNLDKYGEEIAKQIDVEYLFYKKQRYYDLDKEILYQIIYKERKEISLFKLKQKLKTINIFNINRLSEILKMLLNEGFIVFTPHGVKHQYPSIVYYVRNKQSEYPLLNERFQGKTLEEIGDKENLSRERIRQKVNQESINLQFNRFFEWRFVLFYEHYNLTEEEFCQIFDLNNQQYNFLKIFFTKNSLKEMKTKEDLFESDKLGIKEQEKLLNIINKNYLIYANHRIEKSKIGIISYALKLYAKETIHIKSFQKELLNFCEKVGLDDEEFDFNNLRALEGVISRVDNVLLKYGRELRYYAIDKDIIVEMLGQIDFNRYMNKEISARRILLDYPDVFQTLEIQDEYELHNLLKKNENILPDFVKLIRMPLLDIGNSDREEQLLNLLIEYSPIEKDEFAKKYSDKYGVRIETVKANYVSLLKEFEKEDILDADTPVIKPKTLDQLRNLLIDDFYFKEDIYQLYQEEYNETLHDYMFQYVDYINYTDFILKKCYKRADKYFYKAYFNQPMFTIDDKRLKTLGSFRKPLEELRNTLDIFEYMENEYIHIQTIQEKTEITKTDIQKLIDEILNEVGDKYFTIPMIEPIIEESELYTLGFDNIFYESILKGNKYLRFQYMGGQTVFRKTTEKFYIYQLIEENVTRIKYIQIDDLMNYLDEEYSIKLSRESIIQTTEMTDLYYHPILEIIFQDIDQFYEFMEED